MNVIMMPIDAIAPYEQNAKKHPEEQVEHIANSIREFGWQQPLVVDKNNVLVIGHGRLLAAKHLGLTEVPVVQADQLSEQQIAALRLADNKTNESAWDIELLNIELESIDELDMSDFGFANIELDAFFDDGPQPNEPKDKKPSLEVVAFCTDEDEKNDLVQYLKDHNIQYEDK